MGFVRCATRAFVAEVDPSGEGLFLASECLDLEALFAELGVVPALVDGDLSAVGALERRRPSSRGCVRLCRWGCGRRCRRCGPGPCGDRDGRVAAGRCACPYVGVVLDGGRVSGVRDVHVVGGAVGGVAVVCGGGVAGGGRGGDPGGVVG